MGITEAIASITSLNDEIELKLDEADRAAKQSSTRYTAAEVFGRARGNTPSTAYSQTKPGTTAKSE